jgi:hypothetical protein
MQRDLSAFTNLFLCNKDLVPGGEIMKWHSVLLLGVSIAIVAALSSPAWAAGKVNVAVKTVLASQGSEFIDPELAGLAQELQSLFRYSSYRLLSKDRLSLSVRETGTVSLPGNRVLKITPAGVEGKRVELQLVILKKEKQIFETVIQLLNKGSIIVGGPKHKDGSLLFNISASF